MKRKLIINAAAKVLLFSLMLLLGTNANAAKHTLTFFTNPDYIGTICADNMPFENGESMELEEGQSITIDIKYYDYSYSGAYRFVDIRDNHGNVWTDKVITYTMGGEDAALTVNFRLDIPSPGNPKSNCFDPESGTLWIEDFTPGNLQRTIEYAVGRDNESEVKTIKVYGQITDSDIKLGASYTISNYFNNLATIDLSATRGATYVPEGCIYGMNYITNLILPASIDSIGPKAFYGCNCVKYIKLNSAIPPKVTTKDTHYSHSFDEMSDELIFEVPAQFYSLYATDDEWSKVRVMPSVYKNASFLIKLPENNSDGRFRNCVAELQNLSTEIKVRQTIGTTTDFRLSATDTLGRYRLKILTPSGKELGSTEIKCNRSGDYEINIPGLKNPASLSVIFSTADGIDVTSGVNIRWTENGSSFGAGTELSDIPEGTTLSGKVELDKDLSKEFANPADIGYTATANGADTLRLRLNPLARIEIKGRIIDEATRNPLSGAYITLIQRDGSQTRYSEKTISDSYGYFNISAIDSYDKDLHISALGYEDMDCTAAIGSIPDIGLKMIYGSRIYIDVNRNSVTPEDANNFAGCDIVFEVNGHNLPDFKQQYNNIDFYSYLNPGSAIEITAHSPTGKFRDVTKTVTIDESGDGYVLFDIVEKGSVQLSIQDTETIPAVVRLYDSTGNGISKIDCNGNTVDFNYLESGIYSAIMMEKHGLYNNFPDLSSFSSSPLKENIDYTKTTFEIREGEQAKIDCGVVKKIQSMSSSALTDGCYLTAAPANAFQSQYFTLSAKIMIVEEVTSRMTSCKLVLDIPAGMEFIEGCVVAGNKIKAYVHDGNKIILSASQGEVVKYVLKGVQPGEYHLGGLAIMLVDGQEIAEPLPEVSLIVYPPQIFVPSQIASNTISIHGGGIPHANVLIYDDNVLLGETKSNGKGDWESKILLSEIGKISYHNISAKIVDANGEIYRTETKSVVRNLNIPILKSTTIKYLDETVVFNHEQRSKSTHYYTYRGQLGKYDYTFFGDIECGNPEKLENVMFKITCHDNSVTTLPAIWDAENKRFIAKTKFVYGRPLHVPVFVNMSWDCPECGNAMDEKERIEHEHNLESAYLTNLVDLYSFDEIKSMDDGKSVSLTYKIGNENSTHVATIALCDPSDLDAAYPQSKVIGQSNWKMTMGNDKSGNILVYIWQTEGKALSFEFGEGLQSSSRKQACSRRIPLTFQVWEALGNLVGDAAHYIINERTHWDNLIKHERSQNEVRLKQLSQQIFKLTPCGTYKIPDRNVRNQLMAEVVALTDNNSARINRFQDAIEGQKNMRNLKLMYDGVINVALPGLQKGLSKLPPSETEEALDAILAVEGIIKDLMGNDDPLSIWDVYELEAVACIQEGASFYQAAFKKLQDILVTSVYDYLELDLAEYGIKMRNEMANSHINLMKRIIEGQSDVECGGDGEDPVNDEPNPEIFPVKIIIDPSGYVYEGTDDNRIPGVKATAWYLDNGQERLWDAAEYGQNNPLFTDSEGHYEWDVPVGMWKVKFEKDGYLDAESEWLPVPPPQMDVNIEMVSLAAPAVENVKAYPTRLELHFDRFVDAESILLDKYSLISADGRNVEGRWEANRKGDFSDRFTFTPDNDFSTEYVHLTINGNLKSKAGVELGQDYSNDIKVEEEGGIESIPAFEESKDGDAMSTIMWRHDIAECHGAEEIALSDIQGRVLRRVKGEKLDARGVVSGFYILTATSQAAVKTLKIYK